MSDQNSTPVNNSKLFVGNLPFSTSEDDLRNLFSQFGEIVSVTLVIDRMSGRSKGFGFVEFASEEMAKEAIAKMENFELNERKLIVNVARPMEKRTGGFNRGSGGGRDYNRSGGYNNRQNRSFDRNN